MQSPDLTLQQLLIEGSFRKTVEALKARWSEYETNIGPYRPQTVWSQVRYADILRLAGDYEEAVEVYRDLLVKMKIHSEIFKEAVLDVKLSLANIIYRRNVDEAAVVLAEVEEIVAGRPMDDTKIALKKKLAETMRDLGRYERALAYFDEIYQRMKFISSECSNDPRRLDELSSHVDVATVYLEQGRYMKAMDILSSVHEEAKIINPNHPCTLKADRYIADVCVHYGITLIACQKYEHIALVQKTENPNSLDTLTTLHKLSLAYLKDGRPKEALETIEGVYNTRKVETPWHPDTKRVEIDFIMMQLREGDVSKATCLFLKALESKSECFDFELVVEIPRNIAMFFRELDESDKAREAIEIYENLFQKQCQMARLDPMHPETLLTKTKIAETYLYLRNPDINVLDEEGKTVLHWACQKGDIETVNLLLNKGADPRVKDKSGDSALDVAEKLNQGDIVQTIKKYLEGLNLLDPAERSPSKEVN